MTITQQTLLLLILLQQLRQCRICLQTHRQWHNIP